MAIDSDAQAVLDFWFGELTPEQWFMKDESVDAAVRDRFRHVHDRLAHGYLPHWQDDADSCLAAIVALDQFPRNLYRGDPRAFATDDQARALAEIALEQRYDEGQPDERRVFFYMPFEHSEALADQQRCCALMAALSNSQYYDYAVQHRDIIAQFGRFPHRNAILGRESTAEEKAFLEQPGSSF